MCTTLKGKKNYNIGRFDVTLIIYTCIINPVSKLETNDPNILIQLCLFYKIHFKQNNWASSIKILV